ncbi:MAG: NADPH-dependent 7-cyano-7-deazaguanine reductase QueF [Planctomycetes bacterium]|nr:NADPH-dependent 7-cyano-7-deazaguanine reductase QueF [Planctomycetota bacterium]
MPGYASKAKSGLDAELPKLETWENQFPGYTITVVDPEYNAICPKTGLPDFGSVTIQYEPDKRCLELKSFKMYMTAYRDVGIFYENAVNRILRDLTAACDPVWMNVTGEFRARGGIATKVEARYKRRALP